MNTIHEAKAFGARLMKIHREKFLSEQREEYREYCAEARACGYVVVSFEEYIGERDLKAEFLEYYAEMTNSDLELH